MVKEKDEDEIERIFVFSIWILGVVIIFFIGAMVGNFFVEVGLTQETADDVCQQLTGDSTAVASEESPGGIFGSKLVCTIPSYDSPQNIIIKTNNE